MLTRLTSTRRSYCILSHLNTIPYTSKHHNQSIRFYTEITEVCNWNTAATTHLTSLSYLLLVMDGDMIMPVEDHFDSTDYEKIRYLYVSHQIVFNAIGHSACLSKPSSIFPLLIGLPSHFPSDYSRAGEERIRSGVFLHEWISA